MTSLDSLPLELIGMIVEYLDRKEKYALRQTSRFFRAVVPPKWHAEMIRLTVISGMLAINSSPLDVLTSSNFFCSNSYAVHSSKKLNKETGELTIHELVDISKTCHMSMTEESVTLKRSMNCFRRFAFPPVSKYSIFNESVKIGHLDVCKIMPYYLDDGNMEDLTNLFSGCTVDKMTLVLDIDSLSKMDQIPAFLASFHATHVEFYLERNWKFDMITPFMTDCFSDALVGAGIRSVTFSGDRYYGRNQKRERSMQDIHQEFPSELLVNLFKAGINDITVNPGVFDVRTPGHVNHSGFEPIKEGRFHTLLQSTAELSKSLRLELNCFFHFNKNFEKSGVPDLSRRNDLQLGRTIQVARRLDPIKNNISPFIVTIEYKKTDADSSF